MPAILTLSLLTEPTWAKINVVLSTATPLVRTGDRVLVELRAVSDDGAPQIFLGLDAVLTWDPTVLALRSDLGGSPYQWTFVQFPNDQNLDRLNADCGPMTFCVPYTFVPFNDGDAFYQAVVLFPNPPPEATAEGLLITTLEFEALAPTTSTQIGFLETTGQWSATRVATENAIIVTGALVSRSLGIALCGERGDFDGDCQMTLRDFQLFEPCLGGPGLAPDPVTCGPADIDLDGDVDLRDLRLLQLNHAGP